MAAPKDDRTLADGTPLFQIAVYRKQLVGEATRPHDAFRLIADELFAGVAVKLRGGEAKSVRETFEFVAAGHVFTVDVKPSDEL